MPDAYNLSSPRRGSTLFLLTCTVNLLSFPLEVTSFHHPCLTAPAPEKDLSRCTSPTRTLRDSGTPPGAGGAP